MNYRLKVVVQDIFREVEVVFDPREQKHSLNSFCFGVVLLVLGVFIVYSLVY